MSLQTGNLTDFDQYEYSNRFYCCDNDHPFIAFTTCYCPLCQSLGDVGDLMELVSDLEQENDACQEQLSELIFKANKLAPEILV